MWVDGVHFNIRLEDDRLCTLVMIGAKANGEKELLAVEDGYRESAESWKTVLRELKRRGLRNACEISVMKSKQKRLLLKSHSRVSW
jgi:putative transposase